MKNPERQDDDPCGYHIEFTCQINHLRRFIFLREAEPKRNSHYRGFAQSARKPLRCQLNSKWLSSSEFEPPARSNFPRFPGRSPHDSSTMCFPRLTNFTPIDLELGASTPRRTPFSAILPGASPSLLGKLAPHHAPFESRPVQMGSVDLFRRLHDIQTVPLRSSAEPKPERLRSVGL